MSIPSIARSVSNTSCWLSSEQANQHTDAQDPRFALRPSPQTRDGRIASRMGEVEPVEHASRRFFPDASSHLPDPRPQASTHSSNPSHGRSGCASRKRTVAVPLVRGPGRGRLRCVRGGVLDCRGVDHDRPARCSQRAADARGAGFRQVDSIREPVWFGGSQAGYEPVAASPQRTSSSSTRDAATGSA